MSYNIIMNLILEPIKVDEEIELRQFTLPDAKSLFALTNKNRAYLKEWLPWLDEIKVAEDTAKKFIQPSLDKVTLGKGADFGIYYKGGLVGAIGFHDLDNRNKKTTIGYWIDQSNQGNGIITRAVKSLIEIAFNNLKLNRIQINCAVGNNKSCAIPERLGFKKEGTTRQTEWLYDHFVDWEQYSLLSSDWNISVL